MSISPEFALETARTFGNTGSLLTLENGALFVAGINVFAHSLLLVAFLLTLSEGIFGEGELELGCKFRSECLRVTPGEAIFIGGLGTAFIVPMIYLNVRLYSAVQEKDDDFVYLWLKISSGLTLLKALNSPNIGYIIFDLVELWLVHAYQKSEELKRWTIRFPVPVLVRA